MDDNKIEIFNLTEHFNSAELAEKLAILHRRKGELNTTIRNLQTQIGQFEKGTPERSVKTQVLNNYLAEQSGVAELICQYNVLYKSAIDQIMLDVLKEHHHDIFEKVLAKAKVIYEIKTTGKNV